MAMQGAALRSIQHPESRVRVCYRHRDLEVMVVEIGPRCTLSESTLWGASAWHFVIDGQAVFAQAGTETEVLPDGSVYLESGAPYTIANRSRDRLKLLSVIVSNGGRGESDPNA